MTITMSTAEAMAVLHKNRPLQIKAARILADQIITEKGTATSGDVYEAMNARGLIDHTQRQHWLGCVFRNKKYRWTGNVTTGKGHDVLAKEWAFAR